MKMRKALSILALPVVAGCLTASVPEVSHWPLDYQFGGEAVEKAKYGVVRVSQVTVRAPYDLESLAVLRADGSVSFDTYNVYAAAPGVLMRGCVFDALTASGLFKTVINSSSTVHSDLSVELQLTRLALDCRESGARVAKADVILRVIDDEGELVKTVPAGVSVDAADGNYGRAFSKAISVAMEKALGELR